MKRNQQIKIGIDASRNRSGGAKAHLRGILEYTDPEIFGISEIHVWSYSSLLDQLPQKKWLKKHTHPYLEKNIAFQLLWQRFFLPREFASQNCDILLNPDAGTISNIHPSVTMSRDMLSYEPGEIERYGYGRKRLRLYILRYVQSNSLKKADGAVFLTKHAGRIIQRHCGSLKNVAYIPHGVGESFRDENKNYKNNRRGQEVTRCVYVSNVAPYKHQWHVVEAIKRLRDGGQKISLLLVGGGNGPAQKRLEEVLARHDPSCSFVTQLPFVDQNELPAIISKNDIFVFASSCENMPNSLLEGMAVGLPIACSNRGPMPEVLRDGGLYFDPEDVTSIESALQSLLSSPSLREEKAEKAHQLAQQYSWQRCGDETWQFLRDTLKNKFHMD